MKNQLDRCREQLYTARKSFLFKFNAYNRIKPPTWMKDSKGTELEGLYKYQKELMNNGRIIWGAIVQANVRLFKPGDDDHPAAVVFSPDRWFDDNLEALKDIASTLYDQKDLENPDQELTEFSKVISDEHIQLYNIEIPKSKTDGRLVYYTTTMISRKHLPDGMLSLGFFPYLSLGKSIPFSLILPSKYWDKRLIKKWKE